MANYVVSARKYRPESFTTLIGQDNIARTLQNSITRGQLAHAYLFCGPRGVGKTTTARIFAKMINCSEPLPGGEPCGKCESCVSFAEGRSYCIYEMDAASNNSVNDIKELIDKVRIPPQVGKYSVYIIDEVHMLSQSAFNAFLKTLEEPPEYAVFILATTEKHKILPTILSRCQTYDFNRISVGDMVKNLKNVAAKENVTIDDESLHVIAVKADGAMRDALTIFDQTVAFCGTEVKYADVIRNLNVLDFEYSFALVENFLTGDYATALRTFDEILSKGFNALHFISSLSSHLRNLLVSKAGGNEALLDVADSVKERYRMQSAGCGGKFLLDALTLTVGCEQGYKMAVNPRLHIEFCLMKLCALAATAQNPAAVQTTVQAAAAPPAPAAPAASPVPPVPPVPAETSRKRVSPAPGLSLKSIAGNEQGEAAAAIAPVSNDILSDTAISDAWKKFCEICVSNKRLYTALTTAKVEISSSEDKKTVRCSVLNEAQRAWIESFKSRMETKFREVAGSSRLDVVIDVQPEDEVHTKVMTPEEKAGEMMEKNPEVRSWITDLGLEIK